MENYYVLNKETQKLELHFDKETYQALEEKDKSAIKSNFLFSRHGSCWVSRAKFPNLYRAESVAKALGLEDAGKKGDSLSFEEQMQNKAEKAERKAEYYAEKARESVERGNALQKPINDMHGDIAFFTQPNINSSGGRAFTRRREKMFAAWDRGFEEFKKSEYYKEKAAAAMETAESTRPTDKGFIDRRIKDAEKAIRTEKQNLERWYNTYQEIENGKVIKRAFSEEVITLEFVAGLIEKHEMILENAISKAVYYHDCLEALGGVTFSKENVKVGQVVLIKRWGECKVIGTGPKNITFQIMRGGSMGCPLKAAYAEIEKIISEEIIVESLPFRVGEEFTVDAWNGEHYAPKTYTVTKVTDEKVTLKSGTERAITRKPRKFRDGSGCESWALGIVDGTNGTIYRRSGEAAV